MYDAGDYEIRLLQGELAKNGISQDQLDLCNYAGLTYCELKASSTQRLQIRRKGRH